MKRTYRSSDIEVKFHCAAYPDNREGYALKIDGEEHSFLFAGLEQAFDAAMDILDERTRHHIED